MKPEQLKVIAEGMRKLQIDNPIDVINKLKVFYYERWNPEEYGYMSLEITSGAVLLTNNIDCDGNIYFNHKTFLKVIEKWEVK